MPSSAVTQYQAPTRPRRSAQEITDEQTRAFMDAVKMWERVPWSRAKFGYPRLQTAWDEVKAHPSEPAFTVVLEAITRESEAHYRSYLPQFARELLATFDIDENACQELQSRTADDIMCRIFVVKTWGHGGADRAIEKIGPKSLFVKRDKFVKQLRWRGFRHVADFLVAPFVVAGASALVAGEAYGADGARVFARKLFAGWGPTLGLASIGFGIAFSTCSADPPKKATKADASRRADADEKEDAVRPQEKTLRTPEIRSIDSPHRTQVRHVEPKRARLARAEIVTPWSDLLEEELSGMSYAAGMGLGSGSATITTDSSGAIQFARHNGTRCSTRADGALMLVLCRDMLGEVDLVSSYDQLALMWTGESDRGAIVRGNRWRLEEGQLVAEGAFAFCEQEDAKSCRSPSWILKLGADSVRSLCVDSTEEACEIVRRASWELPDQNSPPCPVDFATVQRDPWTSRCRRAT
jgi:hypothetical protein